MVEKKQMFMTPFGNKIPLYAEVGKYFAPDGTFDELYFRNILNEYLEKFKEKYASKDEFKKKTGEWFSTYLSSVLEYLSEKGMLEASFNLFNSAIEEFTKLGIKKVHVSSELMKKFMQRIPLVTNSIEKKKVSVNEKRQIIFDAAVKVFSEDGFHKATMDKVASASGVGKGSLYRYFKSKEELLSQLLIEKYSVIVEQFKLIFLQEHDVIQQIKKMIEFWISFIEENYEVYRLIQSEAISQKPGSRTMFYDYIISHLPMLKERIVSLNLDKKIKTTSFYSVFYGILGFIDGVVYKWTRNGKSYPLKDELPIIIEVLFNGFIGENWTKQHYHIPSVEEN